MNDCKYFHRVEYIIPEGWYRNNIEVINVTLHFAPNNIVFNYKIYFDEEFNIDNEPHQKYLIKLYSNVDKLSLQIYLNQHSNRIEKWVVK